MTEAELEEWREHPATREINAALKASIEARRASATAAYWAGNPWPEAERTALLNELRLWEDMFEASAADFSAIKEMRQE